MQTFLANCCARDRKILKMKVAGHQQRQIAARLGISPPAVNQRLRRLESRWLADAAA
jgi:DNA-binding CsgD family transcriptional regulator